MHTFLFDTYYRLAINIKEGKQCSGLEMDASIPVHGSFFYCYSVVTTLAAAITAATYAALVAAPAATTIYG